ncbi:hypothetical protein SG34_021370 [Thalassomonas viridans]|uniref:Uncharacterized protein n=1 Tax=Thalassomonas viridans TaxID=137584 RepID=A0AAF0C871_9GAMM|nr:hypothetical protein [Thalassomonas viridans]WDE03900.1 hypothetical protein SG34_021370 [Thalassomonas viridans]
MLNSILLSLFISTTNVQLEAPMVSKVNLNGSIEQKLIKEQKQDPLLSLNTDTLEIIQTARGNRGSVKI